MKKYLWFILLIFIFNSCYENITDNPIPNKPPKTYISLFPDTSISQQQSRLRLHWWGDDPDGMVIGYYISIDGVNWKFTVSNDSLISFPLSGTDTVYNFRVAAVDNYGNNRYDAAVIRNGINFGPEPFVDLDSNGVYTEGEPYTDIGEIDPNPVMLKLPLKNSPPELRFLVDKNLQTIKIPDTTFTVASFGWAADDVDGVESINGIYIALNDTSEFVQLPGTTRFVTLKAKPPFSGTNVECEIYLGTSNVPYPVKLPNLLLDSKNRFYVYATDIAGAKSEVLSMPGEGGTWFVMKPTGEILIIDDYAINDNTGSFYNLMLDSLNLNGKYNILDIKRGKTSTTYGELLPKFISPMFTETLKLFKAVIWYTDNDPTIEPAQISIPNYVNSGGKILFSMIFPQVFDTRGLNDFLPVDSLSENPISFIFPNTKVDPTPFAVNNGYPELTRDASPSPVARIRTFYTNSLTADNLYTLGVAGNPVIGFKSKDSRIVFMGLPLNRLNGSPFKAKDFLNKVLIQEFGVSK